MLARLLLAASIAFAWAGVCLANNIPDLTAAQWREDIDALVAGLARNHRDPWNFTSQAEIGRLADEAAAKAGKVDSFAMLVALQRIAAAIGDGHSFVAVSDRYWRYPVEIRWIEGEFHIVGALPGRSGMLGSKLIAIDDVPTAQAVEKLLALVPRNENRWYERDAVAGLLTHAQPLNALGVTRRAAEAVFTVETAAGRREKVRLVSHAPAGRPSLVTIGSEGTPVVSEPERGLRLRLFDDVAYLDFAGYQDLAKTGPGIWAAIDDAKPRALIVDFRKNRGGSLPAGRQYMVYPAWERAQLNREGCLFVLTGPATFSAAMTNVTDMRRETEAILVGLPTGARPNGYQENKWFALPNSGLRVSAAQRRYRFGAPGETTVTPDIQVEQTIDDWRNGRDTVLQTALGMAGDCQRNQGR